MAKLRLFDNPTAAWTVSPKRANGQLPVAGITLTGFSFLVDVAVMVAFERGLAVCSDSETAADTINRLHQIITDGGPFDWIGWWDAHGMVYLRASGGEALLGPIERVAS